MADECAGCAELRSLLQELDERVDALAAALGTETTKRVQLEGVVAQIGDSVKIKPPKK